MRFLHSHNSKYKEIFMLLIIPFHVYFEFHSIPNGVDWNVVVLCLDALFKHVIEHHALSKFSALCFSLSRTIQSNDKSFNLTGGSCSNGSSSSGYCSLLFMVHCLNMSRIYTDLCSTKAEAQLMKIMETTECYKQNDKK